MKEVTVLSKNGVALDTPEQRAILLANCVKWYENASGYAVIRYDSNPGSNTQPESLTIDASKAAFDLLVASETTLSVLSMSIYDLVTGVKTTTVFNQKYLASMVDSKVSVAGTVDTSVVQVTYNDGSFKTKTVYADGVLTSLVASNRTDLILTFLDVPEDTIYTYDLVEKTIDVTVAFGAVVTALVASFVALTNVTSVKVGGVSQVSESTANDFTNPVTYVIVAQDGITTTDWVVTVTVLDMYA